MKKSKRQLFSRIAVICLFCTGVMVMTYPFYVNALNNFLDQQQMTYYLTKEKNVAAERQRLEVENERLKRKALHQVPILLVNLLPKKQMSNIISNILSEKLTFQNWPLNCLYLIQPRHYCWKKVPLY